MASSGGMLPEQVWDTDPLAARRLFPGRPTGSAMPLAWAHAEFVKLVVSRPIGRPCDRLDGVWRRYGGGARPDPDAWVWTPGATIASVPAGKDLWLVLRSLSPCAWG